jgi:trans-2,3-dihydro-3-hydroxyanthranilate isomerase
LRHRYFVADVFTDRPLAGNQVAVFTDGSAIPAELMQKVAREFNLSETVFVLAPESGGDARVRIFTPQIELPFAGHPILGTAFVLAELDPSLSSVRLETGAGTITLTVDRNPGSVLSGRFSQEIPRWRLYPEPESLLAALGARATELPIDLYESGPGHVYVELENESSVATLNPDTRALEALGAIGVNCFAGSGRRWKNRMFAPGAGVREDPATGSAAGPLALHLARHGRISFGDQIEIIQGVEILRPSVLLATAFGTRDRPDHLEVAGSGVLVAEGALRLD